MTDHSVPAARAANAESAAVSVKPLERRDPPALGEVTLTGRLHATDTGTLYAGQLDGEDVVVVLLSEGAERDSFARARFAVAIGDLARGTPDAVAATDSDDDIAPWVALKGVETDEVLGVLDSVTLDDVEPVGRVAGPPFRPHWYSRRGPGRWRLWPLPWPRSLTEATIASFVASFAMVLAISSIALWIAVELFKGQGPAPVLPPFPTNGTDDTVTVTPTSPTPTPSTTGPTTPGPTGSSGPTSPGEDGPPIV